MSNDYALFIIIVPNDFELENAPRPATPSADSLQSTPRRSSLDAISALMATASMFLPTEPILTPLTSPDSQTAMIPPAPATSICVLLKNYLAERIDIEPVWILSENQKTFQITFSVEFGLSSDRMLQDLTRLSYNSPSDVKVFVLPTTIILRKQNRLVKDEIISVTQSIEEGFGISEKILDPANTDNLSGHGLSTRDKTLSMKIRKRINESDFRKSVRARLMVHQVVASIRASSAISFDFVLLICLASMLAAFGLLENSTVILVASMLVSPLMNPILGIVFGLSIREPSLWRRGFRNEMIGLIICITCGFLLGFSTMVFETKWGSSSSFPTSEMKSRGDIKRLWVGVFIAIPSGAGVALSVLGGNTGSLVGVAISASLLPPAVNCGLLFAYAILGKLFPHAIGLPALILNAEAGNHSSSLSCGPYLNNDYIPLYNCNLATESAILACCSLLLTIVNIICIIIMGLFILRIKEVVPLHNSNKNVTEFFHHDVKVARDYNKTIHHGDSTTISSLARNQVAQSIVNHWKTFKASTIDNGTPASLTLVNLAAEAGTTPTEHTKIDTETRRKLFRLRSFAKEYDLDVLNKTDYDLQSAESEEKVRLLVNDLLDMSHETASVFYDLASFPSFTRPTPSDKESIVAFYQEIIELLPPKWYELFISERQQRCLTLGALTFPRSYPMRSYPLATNGSLFMTTNEKNQFHQSLKKCHPKPRTTLQRQCSMPDGTVASNKVEEPCEVPIEGTRFRIVKPI